MAVTQGGKLFVWGDGQAGQHFLGDTDSRLVPTQVGGALDGATVVDVSGGAEHSLVSLDDGTVWGCGARGNGRLGIDSENGRLGIDEGEKEGEGTKPGSSAAVVMIPGVGALAKETDYGVALVEIPIVPGKLQDAFSLFTEHPHGLKYTATQPGFLSMTVALDATKNSVVLLEKWEKKEDWTAYDATRHVEEGELGASNAAWGAEFGPLVGGAPRMVSMDCEKHYEKAAVAEDEKEGEKVDEKEDEHETEEVSVEAPAAVVKVAAPAQPPAPTIEASVLEAPAVEALVEAGGATYTLEQLTGGCPDGVNPDEKELYLSDAEFEVVFKVDKATFEKLPKWKRVQVR